MPRVRTMGSQLRYGELAVIDHRFTVYQAPPQALHTMTTTRAAWVRPSTSPKISTSFPQITQPN